MAFVPPRRQNFGLGAVLISCLVSKLQKPSSPGLEPMTLFRDCGPLSCNIPAKTNNFGFRAVRLLCLVSELQEPPSPGLESSTLFGCFDLSKISYWFLEISVPSLRQIVLNTLSSYKRTYTPTISILYAKVMYILRYDEN
jgi:hypothetical protein